MATERIAAQLSFNVASMTLSSANSVSRVVEFLVEQVYKLARFGLKQLIGSNLKG